MVSKLNTFSFIPAEKERSKNQQQNRVFDISYDSSN